jgi:hypothetical protein
MVRVGAQEWNGHSQKANMFVVLVTDAVLVFPHV